MKRMLSDFNSNIEEELNQTIDLKKNKILIDFNKQKADIDYIEFRKTANEQGQITKKIKKFSETDPAYSETLKQMYEFKEQYKYEVKKRYNSRIATYNKLTGGDYELVINVFSTHLSSKEEYKKPIKILKSKLLKKKNPALFIMLEQKKRIGHELNDVSERINATNETNLSQEEKIKLEKLKGAQKGLGVLYEKAVCGILMEKNGTGFEETVEENSGLLEELAEALETGETGSNGSPFFYVPLSTMIDIL